MLDFQFTARVQVHAALSLGLPLNNSREEDGVVRDAMTVSFCNVDARLEKWQTDEGKEKVHKGNFDTNKTLEAIMASTRRRWVAARNT